jgi:cystathionine gamma-synthase
MGTLLSHAGLSTSMDPTMQNEALCPPIHLETTYTRPPSGDYNSAGEGGKGWVYSRMGNPTRNELEKVMTILETFGGTKDISSDYTTTTTNNNNKSMDSNALIESTVSCAFSSGMAAVSSIILATLSQNQLHIILPDDIYHGVPSQLKTTFIEQGVTYSSVDMTNIQQIEKEVESIIHGNIIVWMESPSNPLCKVTDIQTVCDWVKETREVETNEEKKIVTVVDSTWAPPCITQPVRNSHY